MGHVCMVGATSDVNWLRTRHATTKRDSPESTLTALGREIADSHDLDRVAECLDVGPDVPSPARSSSPRSSPDTDFWVTCSRAASSCVFTVDMTGSGDATTTQMVALGNALIGLQ